MTAARATDTRTLTPAVVIGFVAIVLVLFAGLAVAIASLRTVYLAANAVAHTSDVKGQLESVMTTLLDAETGERGYIITGDAAYLEPYQRAVGAIAAELARVRRLTADNREHQQDLDQLAAQANVKLDELASAIQARRDAGFEAAQTIVLTNIGKQTMDGIRASIARMDAREEALLTLRTAEADAAYDTTRLTAAAIAAVGLGVVAALFFVTRRVGSERRTALSLAQQLRVTLSSIGDGVIVTDAAGHVTHVNPVAERLIGWTESAASGKSLHEVFVVVDEDSRQPVDNPIERVLREGVVAGLANHTVLVARDGAEIPVDDSAAPIKTAGGDVAGAVLVFRDVTQRRRVERERSSLISELEAAVRARDDFVSIASHELRNPLNALQLQLTGILRAFQRASGELPAQQLRDRVAHADQQVGRLARLLDNLLDVSRIGAGAIALELEEVNLADVVETVVDQFRGEAAPGQIAFNPGHRVLGRWDRLRLEQIVSNVLSNAIKYGNGRPIVISVDGDTRVARLSVTDHGIGIAPEQHQRLFARFERGVSGARYGGFGLGLWITRQLVDAMGGTISVASQPGQGATFSIVLPLRGVAAARLEAVT